MLFILAHASAGPKSRAHPGWQGPRLTPGVTTWQESGRICSYVEVSLAILIKLPRLKL